MTTTDRTMTTLIRKLERAELAHLRRHVAELDARLLRAEDEAELKAAWRRAELWKRGISFDAAMNISYLRAAMCGAVKAQQKTAARHARAMMRAPYND